MKIGRRQLTALLLGIPLAFVSIAWLLSKTGTIRPEAKLEVEIDVRAEAWTPPKSDGTDTRLYPCVVLKNPTTEPWKNVTIALNKQFYFYAHLPLDAGGVLVTPLEHFVTKGGNITFRPGSQQVHQLTVFAQLPNGERAVYEAPFEGSKP